MPKSQEELAREKAQVEKDKAQSQVDSVLYQDKTRPRQSANSDSNSSSESPKKKNPIDTHDFVRNGNDVDEQVKVTPPPSSIEFKQEVAKQRVANPLKHYDDDDVEDFKDHFGESDDDNIKEVVPEKFISTKQNTQEYDEDMAMDAAMSLYNESADEYNTEYENGDSKNVNDDEFEYSSIELNRQAKEEALRQKTAQANKRNIPKPPPRPVGKPDGEVDLKAVKGIPDELIQRIRCLFPEAKTQGEAIAAYIYIKEGKPADVAMPERYLEVMDSFVGETVTVKDSHDELMIKMLELKSSNSQLSHKLETIELAVVYALFDRLGFRKQKNLLPNNVDFLEQGIDDMIACLEKQSLRKKADKSAKRGRPIR